METKKCSKCGEVKSVEEFVKNKSIKSGINTFCKNCRNNEIYFKKYGKVKVKEIIPLGFKKCSKCGEIKSINEYHKNTKDPIGIQSSCKKCKSLYLKNNKKNISIKRKDFYQKNKNIVLERCKKYYKNNKDIINKKVKIYAENNKDKISQKRKSYRIKNKEWLNKYKENLVEIHGKIFNIKTAPDELKPALEGLIILRKKNKIIKELKNG